MTIFTKYFLCLIACFQFLFTFAQEPVLVTDFNSGPDDSFNRFNFEGIEFEGRMIFPITDSSLGEELAVLEDGELSLLMDIHVGSESSNPTEFTRFDDRVFFSAFNMTDGGGIWATDGTEANTVQIVAFSNTSGIQPRGLIVAQSGWLYYTYDSRLYRNNGTDNEFIANEISFRESFNHASGNYSTYRDEIAFMLEERIPYSSDDVINLYTIENGNLSLLATTPVSSGFPQLYGLNELDGGLIFVSEDPFEDVTDSAFFYDNTTEELSPININGERPRRVEAFSPEHVFAWAFDEGFYTMNGIQGQEELLIFNDEITYAAGEEVALGIYEDKITFFYDEGAFGSSFIAISDGTTQGSKNLIETNSFPSNVITDDNYAYMATGTSNGFDPVFHAINMVNETVTNFYSSPSSASVYMLGVLDNQLYFISNLDNTIGLELYSLELDFLSSTRTESTLDAEIKVFSDYYLVQMNKQIQLQSDIYTIDGKLLQSENALSNSRLSLPSYNGSLIIVVTDGERQISKQVIRMSSK